MGPLAEIALDLGYRVSGSDPAISQQTATLKNRGVVICQNQDGHDMAKLHELNPIDWFVYTSALPPDNGELLFARQNGIRASKRHELLNHVIRQQRLKLIAVAGTHGKTTTSAMLAWLLGGLGEPVSYSVGTALSFGPSGRYQPGSRFFVYECDEYDRNFLQFKPDLSVITSLDYDHPDSYAKPEDYRQAFRDFLNQSAIGLMWQSDAEYLGVPPEAGHIKIYPEASGQLDGISLAGPHNRRNAFLAVAAAERLLEGVRREKIVKLINNFPGTARRFEKLADNLYSDYAHHPKEIAATLQLAAELSDKIAVVYQPHQNLRQHAVAGTYGGCFEPARTIYWLPTYLSREDPSLKVLSPAELTDGLDERHRIILSDLDDRLWQNIQKARRAGCLVVAMSAGSLDGWLRQKLAEDTET